jgi:hypothetical protein
MEYLIVQQRWIRNGSQNGEHLVQKTGRRKEANGLVRHNFNSHMDMILKHQIDYDDYEIDEQDHSIALADEKGICYYCRFYVLEV